MNEQMKYEMLPVTGTSLFRIRALRDIPKYNVLKGQEGGLIEKEANLCQSNDGWIHYDSMVTGNATVIDGLLEKKSHVRGNAIILFGVLTSTFVSGNSRIESDIHIEHSEITDTFLEGEGKIKASTLKKVRVKNGIDVKDCYIDSKYGIHFKQKLVMDNVNMQVEEGTVYDVVMWKHVKIKATQLVINEPIFLKHVDIDVSNVFSVKKGELFSQYPTEIIGKNMENPVQVKGTSFRLKDASIKGEVLIEGEVDVIDSSIQDMAHICMHGVVEDCFLTELASIKLSMDKGKFVSKLELDGERTLCD